MVFLGPDLTEKAHLDIPWPLGDLAVDGAASPDGRYFAAQGPDGTLTVWRLPEALATSVGELPAPEALPSHRVLAVGTQLGAPPFAIAEVSLFPEAWYDGELPAGVTPRMLETLGYTDEAQQVVTAIAGFAPRTQQERAEHLAAIRRLATGWDGDDLYLLKDHFLAVHTGGTFYDEDNVERPGDPELLASQLATAVKRHKARKIIALFQAWQSAQPVSDAPAFGIGACPAQSAEVGATMPVPPVSTRGPERRFWDSVVVRVAADGTPSWVGTETKTRSSAGRTCFEAHDGPWTPAQRGGVAVDLCVRVPCSTPAPSEE